MIKSMLTANGSASQTAFNKYQLALAKQLPELWFPNSAYQISAISPKLGGVTSQDSTAHIYPQTWYVEGVASQHRMSGPAGGTWPRLSSAAGLAVRRRAGLGHDGRVRILHFLPGSPARAILGMRATPAAIASFNAANGYNRALPIAVRRLTSTGCCTETSASPTTSTSPSASLLGLDLPKSALLVGLVLRDRAADRDSGRHRAGAAPEQAARSRADHRRVRRLRDADVLAGHAARGHRSPPRCTAAPRRGPRARRSPRSLQQPQALVLPVATLTIVTVAQFSRFMRSSAIDNLLQDYIRTARAKGLPPWQMV